MVATTPRKRRHFGLIRKLPSGRYQAKYWHQGRYHLAESTFRYKSDAQTWLATIESDLARGQWQDPSTTTPKSRETFRAYAEGWLKSRSRLQATTRAKYRGLLDRHLLPAFGNKPLSEIRPDQVSAWYGELAATAPSTAAGSYRLLATICNTAVREEVLVRSPCRVTGGATEHAAERPTITHEELQRAVDAVPENYRCALMLASWCQLRRSEVLALQRGDVDLVSGTIRVRRAWVKAQNGKPSIEPPKSDAGCRSVFMPSVVLEEVKAHLSAHVGAAPEAWLFPGRTDPSMPMNHRTFARIWEAARQQAGRKDLRYHDLRHSGLVWYAQAGATIAELMRRAGHASPAAAMRYQHAADERDRMLATKMAEGR